MGLPGLLGGMSLYRTARRRSAGLRTTVLGVAMSMTSPCSAHRLPGRPRHNAAGLRFSPVAQAGVAACAGEISRQAAVSAVITASSAHRSVAVEGLIDPRWPVVRCVRVSFEGDRARRSPLACQDKGRQAARASARPASRISLKRSSFCDRCRICGSWVTVLSWAVSSLHSEAGARSTGPSAISGTLLRSCAHRARRRSPSRIH